MAELRNITDFIAGGYVPQYHYKSFRPTSIFYDWVIDSPEISQLLSDADRSLGSLNAYAHMVPDVEFFIQMHITKEATTSSRIEGTQTNMEEALVKQEDIQPEKRNDWVEVHNYVRAINYSIDALNKLPICNRLIRDTHRVLMQGVRGDNKLPGEYRRSQNWIGATLRDATYVPPHHEEIEDLMKELEEFMHSDDIHTPPLIRMGMLHYQFETIHPFLDGNGRMGRLLMTLYLVAKKLLVKPALYLSDFFEHHRTYYYDNLHRVRTHNDMNQWLRFFLVGIIETAKSSIQTFKDILELKERVEREKLPQFKSRQKAALEVINLLYRQPVISVKNLTEGGKMNYATANRMINDLAKYDILKEVDFGGSRHRYFMFQEYFSIFFRSPDYRKREGNINDQDAFNN
ncbi:Fic family protein [uncultured Sphingobacterium sp.]|uniref:Fic family protein n=1 Tax=uncultured Sphingobacterium sp. TaxID=182688 RepID=UPI0025932149|nr:Fic family protein [uncultured Sphingobacterium sp.]